MGAERSAFGALTVSPSRSDGLAPVLSRRVRPRLRAVLRPGRGLAVCRGGGRLDGTPAITAANGCSLPADYR